METHIEVDPLGDEQVLVRSGIGRVVEVRGVGLPKADGGAIGPNGAHSEGWGRYTVVIAITPTDGMQSAVKVSIDGLVLSDDPLLAIAIAALRSEEEVAWTVKSFRSAGVPAALPVELLDHRYEVTAWLGALAGVESPVARTEPLLPPTAGALW